MTDQPDLFPALVREAPYRKESDTSRAAARRARPKAGTQRSYILSVIEGSGRGLTMEEIAFTSGVRLQSICGRLSELKQMGLVVDSGTRRKTTSGSLAVVWKATRA